MEELRADLDALEATNRNAAGELREQARLLSARDDELRKLRAAAASAEGLREEAVREAAERTRLERLVRRRAHGSRRYIARYVVPVPWLAAAPE